MAAIGHGHTIKPLDCGQDIVFNVTNRANDYFKGLVVIAVAVMVVHSDIADSGKAVVATAVADCLVIADVASRIAAAAWPDAAAVC